MAQNKTLNIEPAFVAVAAANILNGNVTSLAGPVGFTMTQPYLIVKRIRLNNKDAASHAVTLYKGATGASVAGTEFAFPGVSIPAHSWVEVGCYARFDAADFLVGICDTASVVSINIDAEIGLA